MWLTITAGALALVGGFAFLATWSRLVRARNEVDNWHAQIESHLQRRHDLVPNLVEVVREHAAHDRGSLEAIVRAQHAALMAPTGSEVAARAEVELGRALVVLHQAAPAVPRARIKLGLFGARPAARRNGGPPSAHAQLLQRRRHALPQSRRTDRRATTGWPGYGRDCPPCLLPGGPSCQHRSSTHRPTEVGRLSACRVTSSPTDFDPHRSSCPYWGEHRF
ncbi:MAG: LemA family protein [Holophagales bacterium]|nr:MAG: LemA family protein [Holophagales bacterium]